MNNNKRAIGFWILMIFGIFMLIMLLIGQMMSFINYEFTVSIGLQESVDVISEMGVAINKGFGVGDTIIYIPLLIIGLIGIWFGKNWGILAMAGALGITAYWPMVSIFFLLFARDLPGFNFTDYTSYTILLTAFILYGLWGLGYLYTYQKLLTKE
jgi:hypothetical protein